MAKPAWTLSELLAAQATVMMDIDDANHTVGSYENSPQASIHPVYLEAQRRLPELHKVEALLMERIKEALAPTEGGQEC